MPATPARQLAFQTLMAVEEKSAYASELLHAHAVNRLAAPDRRLATELVLGVLRWRGQLDALIARAARRPVDRIELPALTALRLGAYQMRWLTRMPANAAVHESVELAKAAAPRAAGLVNAALRQFQRLGPTRPIEAWLAAELDPEHRLSIELSHPRWLLQRWSRHFGVEAAAAIAGAGNTPPQAALAWSRPLQAGAVAASLAAAEIEVEPGRLLAGALRVRRGDATRSELYRSGRLWIQDEASQLVAHLTVAGAAAGAELRILDACAAPGGKTALLRDLAPGAGLVALELHPHRARRMRRLARSAGIGIAIADAGAALPLRGSFDRILLDAPCSGTGTLARHPEIRWRLRPEDLARLAALQRRLLGNLLRYLAPGGRLLYSVCSLEPEEGPDVIAGFPGARVLPLELPAGAPAGLLTPEGALRILPGALGTDGFFAALLEAA